MKKFEKRIVDGKEHLFSKIEFDLGEIKSNEAREVNGMKAIILPVGVKFSMQIVKESIKHAIKYDDHENFEKFLDEYARLYLNDLIGVEQYPIQYDENKNIKGISKDSEIL
jgi:hypothetical protein